MPWLDCHQPAEPLTEYKDRPDSQCTAGRKENDAEPANSVTVKRPQLVAVRPRRQIGIQEPDHGEGYDDPAVAAILAYTRTQIAASEERDAESKNNMMRARQARGARKRQ